MASDPTVAISHVSPVYRSWALLCWGQCRSELSNAVDCSCAPFCAPPLLPVRSPKAVADLQARGLAVAMVGDGVNDPRAGAGAGGTRGTITIVCRTRFPAPVAVAAWQDSEPQPELLS